VRHWYWLMLADRVNVVGGMVEDFRKSPRAQLTAAAALGAGYLLWKAARRRR